jgi:hypothetical protein
MAQLRPVLAVLPAVLGRGTQLVDRAADLGRELDRGLRPRLQILGDRIVVELFGLVLGLRAELITMHAHERCCRPLPHKVIGHQRALRRNRRQLLDTNLNLLTPVKATTSQTPRQPDEQTNGCDHSTHANTNRTDASGRLGIARRRKARLVAPQVSLLGVKIKPLVLVAVINGITAGPFPIVTMLVSSDRTITGEHINGSPAGSAGLREPSC